ncbi:MAG: hypothetical protein IJX88_04650 [Clostridia bacterium]|nr:hypothetical protein [Clostridia bacterium]
MKACIVQPPYSRDYAKTEEYFLWEMKKFDECDESMDIIVFPESCDVPCFAPTKEDNLASIEKYRGKVLAKASETAKRCKAIVVVNVHAQEKSGLRNTTVVFDRSGQEVYRYYKQHLTPGETSIYGLDTEYTYEYEEPYVLELEGLRFGFLICYDFYFYEAYAAIARKNVDIVIGCSHQRTDTHATLETINKFCAYHTNAYLLRSSVSMGEDSPVAGCSCVVAPTGEVLADMKSKIGSVCVEFDPKKKFYKPAGYGGDMMAHWQYIEKGRRAWKYRPAGSAICRYDGIMPYPRTCAHRGFNTVAPENSMPAFGAAVSLGAEEIEFDIWATKDGELVSLHDCSLDRVSNGTGLVWEQTYEELLRYDFGVKYTEAFTGLKIVTFEEILKKFACHTVMNIHVKLWEHDEDNLMLEKIVGLIRKYDCEKYVYFMSSSDKALAAVKAYAPDLKICVGHDKNRPYEIVERAIKLGAEKVQLFRPYFNKEMIEKAHANGIICNVFYADTEADAREYLEMGVDTVLTNDYLRISKVVEQYKYKVL